MSIYGYKKQTEGKHMNLARVSCNGQITVPIEIRRVLQVESGDKILFFHKSNGEVVMQNLNNIALTQMQNAVDAPIKRKDAAVRA